MFPVSTQRLRSSIWVGVEYFESRIDFLVRALVKEVFFEVVSTSKNGEAGCSKRSLECSSSSSIMRSEFDQGRSSAKGE